MRALGPYEEAVLRTVGKFSPSYQQLKDEYAGMPRVQGELKTLLNALLERELIQKRTVVAGGFVINLHGDQNPEIPTKEVYVLTPMGESYLEGGKSASSPSYQNIINSNIANDSPFAQQSVDVTTLDPKLQAILIDLEKAIQNKDAKKAGRAVELIIDKGADLGVNLIAQILAKGFLP